MMQTLGTAARAEEPPPVVSAHPPTIVIDDVSHQAAHIVYTFERLFPALLEGGVYIAEDLDRFGLWMQLAQISGRLDRNGDELAALERAVEIRPNDANVRVELAFCLQRAGKLKQALAEAERSVALAAGTHLKDRCAP